MNYMMKYLLMMNVIVLFALNGFAQAGSSGFTLEGTLDKLEDGTMLYLRTNNYVGKCDTLATGKSKGNSFKLTGKLLPEQVGREYAFSIDEKDQRYKKVYGKNIKIYPDNSKMKLSGKLGDKIVITGSPIHTDFMEYSEFIDKKLNVYLNEFVKPVYREFEKKLKADTAADAKAILDGANAFMKYMSKKDIDYSQEWMKSHGASLFAPSLAFVGASYKTTLAENEAMYAVLNEKAQNTYYGRKLKAEIDIQKKVAVGNILPFVTLKNVKGQQLSLQQIAAANELTVVDFWAFWCGPCRASFPHLKDIYDRYKDKGFTVYSVSVDTTYKNWVDALNKEQLPWNNVIVDKPELHNELYGIKAIPTYFLIDKKGKIIGHWVGDMDALEPIIKQYLKL